MARAVELGRPVDKPKRAIHRYLYPIPSAPDIYAKHYQDTRLKKFPSKASGSPDKLELVEVTENSASWTRRIQRISHLFYPLTPVNRVVFRHTLLEHSTTVHDKY